MLIDRTSNYTENPFTLHGVVKRLIATKGEKMAVADISDGTIYEMTRAKNAKVIKNDIREFRKIYLETFDILKDLDRPAVKVFCYILKNLEEGQDKIKLKGSEIKKYCGFKTGASIYKGTSLLIDNAMIAHAEKQGEYWINVDLFYNGKRLK